MINSFLAKYDERDVKIPKIAELNSQLKNPYPVSDFHAMEIKIMILFDWYLGVPTASHFTDYYSMCVILESDCKCIKKMDCERALWREAVQYIHKFLDIILLGITNYNKFINKYESAFMELCMYM